MLTLMLIQQYCQAEQLEPAAEGSNLQAWKSLLWLHISTQPVSHRNAGHRNQGLSGKRHVVRVMLPQRQGR